MHILISHGSLVQAVQLRQKIGQLPQVSKVSTAATITETYNFAEHQTPDCVFICASFARASEFEFLSSLFGIMGIACVVVFDAAGGDVYQPPAAFARRLVAIPEQSSVPSLSMAMSHATGQTRRTAIGTVQTPATNSFHGRAIILIGASTGGIDALLGCIRRFPYDCPPTLIVQHTSGRHAQSLVRLLDNATAAQVVAARDGEPLEPGTIYLSPGGETHLCLSSRSATPVARLQETDLVSGHRPSVDALFSSGIPFARHIAAAILTGMGRDGAEGLVKLRKAGAYTIGQDEKTSVVYGMPRVAMELGGVAEQLPIDRIGSALLAASSGRVRARA